MNAPRYDAVRTTVESIVADQHSLKKVMECEAVDQFSNTDALANIALAQEALNEAIRYLVKVMS